MLTVGHGQAIVHIKVWRNEGLSTTTNVLIIHTLAHEKHYVIPLL